MTLNVIRIARALNKRPLLPIGARERTDRYPPADARNEVSLDLNKWP
jgi:hypothetical protein